MGGGYSGKFAGTAGAIGANKNYQHSLFDKVAVRSKMDGITVGPTAGGSIAIATKIKPCFCCGAFSLPAISEYEVCDICGWIDDPYQNKHPDSTNGRNPISLNDAREQYNQGNS